MTVGIDPGLSDALFFIDPNLPATGTAIDLPAHALVRGGKKHEVDPQGLLALLTPWGRWRGDAALCEALTTAELRLLQLTAPAFQPILDAMSKVCGSSPVTAPAASPMSR